MRKIISILCISIFLFNYAGFYLAFNIGQFIIKEEIKKKLLNDIPNSELSIIIINNHRTKLLNWYDDNKEFSYNHKMYDVVRIENKDSSTIYYCYEDNKENQLNKKLDDHIQTNISNDPIQKANSSKVVRKIANDEFCFNLSTFIFSFKSYIVEYNTQYMIYNTVDLDVLKPPPRYLYSI